MHSEAQTPVRHFFKEMCASRVALCEKCGVNPSILFVFDFKEFKRIFHDRQEQSSPNVEQNAEQIGPLQYAAKKEKENKEFFTHVCTFLFQEILPEVIEEKYATAKKNNFVKMLQNFAVEDVESDFEALLDTCKGDENMPIFQVVAQICAQKISIVKRCYQSLIAIPMDDAISREEASKEQLEETHNNEEASLYVLHKGVVRNDVVVQNLGLQKEWYQIYCPALYWTNQLRFEELEGRSVYRRAGALEKYVMRRMRRDWNFHKCLASLQGKDKLNDCEIKTLKTWAEEWIRKILTERCDSEEQAQVERCAMRELMRWTVRWRNKVRQAFIKNNHIIFYHRSSQKEGIFYDHWEITGYLQKAFFKYSLIEDQEKLDVFMNAYAEDLCNTLGGHFGWKIFHVPREIYRTFLPTEIVGDRESVCICQLARVCGQYWCYELSYDVLSMEEKMHPVEAIAASCQIDQDNHCYSRDTMFDNEKQNFS